MAALLSIWSWAGEQAEVRGARESLTMATGSHRWPRDMTIPWLRVGLFCWSSSPAHAALFSTSLQVATGTASAVASGRRRLHRKRNLRPPLLPRPLLASAFITHLIYVWMQKPESLEHMHCILLPSTSFLYQSDVV